MSKKIIIFIFLLILYLALNVFLLQKNLEVFFLNVGQGDAILLSLPQGTQILVDGGPDNLLLHRLGEVLPWWETKIDYLLISHYHADHIMGFIELVNKYEVGQVLTTAHQPNDFLYSVLMQKLKTKNIPIVFLVTGQELNFGENCILQVLSADKNYEDYNDNSLVLRLSYLDTALLLTGDMTTISEDNLLKQNFKIQADLLKVAHHGSRYSSGQKFLAAVDPKFCIISVGKDNDFQHPHQEALQRLSQAYCQIYLTKDFGTLSWKSDGLQWFLLK